MIAQRLHERLLQICKERGFTGIGRMEFVTGDASKMDEVDTSPDTRIPLHRATIIYCNNYVFPSNLDDYLFQYFTENLQDRVRIVTLKSICPRYAPSNPRFDAHPLRKFRYPWITCDAPPDSVSWCSKPVSYYIYTLARDEFEESTSTKSKLVAFKPKHPGLGARN